MYTVHMNAFGRFSKAYWSSQRHTKQWVNHPDNVPFKRGNQRPLASQSVALTTGENRERLGLKSVPVHMLILLF